MANKDLSAFLIPETLDDPEKILFFTYAELGVLMFPLFVGILSDHTVIGMLIGVLTLLFYKKVISANNGYSITHLMYWYCPEWLFKMPKVPSSSIRIYI